MIVEMLRHALSMAFLHKNKMNETNKNAINVVKESSDDNSRMVDNVQVRYVF